MAEALLADQQDEGVRLRDLLGKRCCQKPPARRLDGAKKTRESASLRSIAALSRSASA